MDHLQGGATTVILNYIRTDLQKVQDKVDENLKLTLAIKDQLAAHVTEDARNFSVLETRIATEKEVKKDRTGTIIAVLSLLVSVGTAVVIAFRG